MTQLAEDILQNIDNKASFILKDFKFSEHEFHNYDSCKRILVHAFTDHYKPIMTRKKNNIDEYYTVIVKMIDNILVFKQLDANIYFDAYLYDLEIIGFENVLSLKINNMYLVVICNLTGDRIPCHRNAQPLIYMSDLKRNVLQELKSLPNIGIDYFEALERFKSNI